MTTQPLIPFTPHDLAEHQARLPAALRPVWYACEGGDRPGLYPEHVFDWPDGLRLIISRDRLGGAMPALHVSASCEPQSALAQEMYVLGDFTAAIALLVERAEARIRELLGRDIPLAGFSPGAHIPHWYDRDPIEED